MLCEQVLSTVCSQLTTQCWLQPLWLCLFVELAVLLVLLKFSGTLLLAV